MRYYRLDRTSGPLPDDHQLHVGTIIRVPRKNSRKAGYVFNPATQSWVQIHWVECDDPSAIRGGAS